MIVIGESSSQGSEKKRIRQVQFEHELELEADDVTPSLALSSGEGSNMDCVQRVVHDLSSHLLTTKTI